MVQKFLLSSGGRELSQRDDNQGHEHRCTQEGGDDNGTDSSGPQRACRDRNHSGVRLGRSLGGRAVGFIPFALHILAPGTPSCHPPAVPVPVSPMAAAWPHAVGSRLAPSQASCQGHRQPAPTGCLALCFPATSTPSVLVAQQQAAAFRCQWSCSHPVSKSRVPGTLLPGFGCLQ